MVRQDERLTRQAEALAHSRAQALEAMRALDAIERPVEMVSCCLGLIQKEAMEAGGVMEVVEKAHLEVVLPKDGALIQTIQARGWAG